MNTINPIQSIRFTGAIGSESRGQPIQSVELQSGQIVKALVVELQSQDKALLQIGDSRISAKTEIPLKAGQPLQLQVTSTSPDVQLKIVGDAVTQFLGKSITLIGKPIDISSLFRSLQQPQQPAPPTTSSSQPSATTSVSPTALLASQASQTSTGQASSVPPQTGLSDLGSFINAQFKAIVTQAQTPGKFTLETGGQQLHIVSKAPLQPGQQIPLQLVETNPVQLQATQDAPAAIAGALFSLQEPSSGTTSLLNIFRQPSSIFEILSPQAKNTLQTFYSGQQGQLGGKEAGGTLKQMIDRIGLSFERQLSSGEQQKPAATLKAALLEIINAFKGSEQITRSAQQLLSTLEVFQLAQLQTETGNQFIFPLPLTGIEQGYLLVDQSNRENSKDQNSKESEQRFSLHLKMSDLGNIRVDMLNSHEGLLIRFHTDSQEKSEFVEEYGDELKKAITNIPVLGLSFGTEAEDPANKLLKHVLPEGSGVLSTKA